ncbi:hypothetical protein, partial [Streptomyces sp. NPDC048277]|uniref:fascin domain-containing protein n=1 Tax=Streptomyces sp. NPDC048277 TaxID=3155027 RepID=UPI0033F33E6D
MRSSIKTGRRAMVVLAVAASAVSAIAVLPSAPAFADTVTRTTGSPVHTLSQAIAELQSHGTPLTRSAEAADDNNGFVCDTANTPIRSVANGDYVTAQIDYTGDQYGMLRAGHATAVGPWEQFNLCRNDTTNTYAIRSVANGEYVTAQIDYTGDQYGMLRARTAAAPGPWEQFTFEPTGNGYAIRALANGEYVTAQIDYTGDQYGMLRARTAAAPGPW